ncbi:MAG: hypothetical protein QM762_17915 [Chryseolinea sp.]
MKKLATIILFVTTINLSGLAQTDLSVDGNIQMQRNRSTIFFQGEYIANHRVGIQFLTFDNGATVVYVPTDPNKVQVPTSQIRFGGFGSFSSQTINVAVSGNMGIGTLLSSNPNGYKLAVNGKIGAKEVQVENSSSTWADYVFKPEYRLMPLSEVEQYVKTNSHLPEIPSAEEVKKDGHNLGEMDVLLLKKIEELTLHLIKQEKEIKELKAQLSELK